jgi:hypothetical protein
VNKRYVDQKFTTLSTNLASKVNKSGDSLTGDLKILLNDDTLRTFGVGDLASGKSVSLLLGNVDNQVRHNFGYAWKLIASYGFKFFCAAGEICRMGAFNDARAVFFQNISMNNNSITDLHDPIDRADAATKQYIDTRCVKNNVGHVPNLITNSNSKAGFIVTASSEVGLSLAYNVFSIIGDWISQEKTSFWIQLKCPEPVRVHKIALRGVRSGVIKNWLLQASNDNDDAYEILYDNYMDTGNTESCIDNSLIIVEIDSIHKYSTYRIWVHNSDGDRPGLSHWQLYTVDSLV